MAYLQTANGAQWSGAITGPTGVTGELVFSTSPVGYPQSVTDPSYCGQILVFAFPLTGTYPVDSNLESGRPWVRGVVTGTCDDTAFKQWLADWGIPVLENVPTRRVVEHIREGGTVRARIAGGSTGGTATANHPCPEGNPYVAETSCAEVQRYPGSGCRLAVIDYGIKEGILRYLSDRSVEVVRFPHTVTPEGVLACDPDGILLSNGPGDPRFLREERETVKGLLGARPLLGICLGHQLLALACGADSRKLPFGHRGANHPVVDCASGRGVVTSQNHGYEVVADSLAGTGLSVSHRHLSDNTVEGVVHPAYRARGVQFHPEASPGPTEGRCILDDFLASISEREGSYV
ncbi:MAG: carbamoyl phosphate synthase small subunit [Synergistales bacterium]|nr:carbamoyl phosphate synthase small subunit [Synergistales bacterium]